jgi:hypothetical protein
MKIFILENSADRIGWFRQYFEGEYLVVTDSPDLAIGYLRTQEFERIYLDDCHGLEVTQYLAESGACPSSRITIHSMNPAVAEEMKNILLNVNRDCVLTPIDKLSSNKVRS